YAYTIAHVKCNSLNAYKKIWLHWLKRLASYGDNHGTWHTLYFILLSSSFAVRTRHICRYIANAACTSSSQLMPLPTFMARSLEGCGGVARLCWQRTQCESGTPCKRQPHLYSARAGKGFC